MSTDAPFEIVPYDPSWPAAFEAEAARIAAALGATALRIDHHGSTSVPGLAAKPIIDIQISVAALQPMSTYAVPLASLGYVHVPDPDDAVCPFFHRPAQWPHTHHVHVVEAGGAEERRTLAFRDYLRQQADAARKYERLKRAIAARLTPRDADAREAYARAKSSFIERIGAAALGRDRLAARAAQWRVTIDRVDENDSSIVGFGRRAADAVVIKVGTQGPNGSREADVLSAFNGRGVVRLLEHHGDALMLERLQPGAPLGSVVDAGSDDRATDILAEVIATMEAAVVPVGMPGARQWGEALGAAGAIAHSPLPPALIDHARRVYGGLCDSERSPRLLHGDLHHGNVLFDATRGWVAIDPKGVVAELEFEVGAALRNPLHRPDVFTDPAAIARRVDRFTRQLRLDRRRVIGWAFAQAVLAVLWLVEDDAVVTPGHPWVTLAHRLEAMMK